MDKDMNCSKKTDELELPIFFVCIEGLDSRMVSAIFPIEAAVKYVKQLINEGKLTVDSSVLIKVDHLSFRFDGFINIENHLNEVSDR